MPACVGTVPEEFIVELGSFCAQSVTGVQIGMFRAAGIDPFSEDENIQAFKQQSIARYLNDCWRSLILQDDEFVTNTFQKLYNLVPNESPLCLFHKVMVVACTILNERPEIGFSTPPAERVPSNVGYVDCFRNVLSHCYKEAAKTKISELYSAAEAIAHQCSGPKFPDIPNENPNELIFSFERAE